MIEFILILLIGVVQADSDWSVIMSAQNTESLAKADLFLKQQKVWEEGCSLERKNSWFPLNCLRLFNDQLEKPQALMESQKLGFLVNRLCQKSYQRLEDRDQIKALLGSLVVPSKCQKLLEGHLLDLSYVAQGELGPNIENN